jgi:hypothetical protein
MSKTGRFDLACDASGGSGNPMRRDRQTRLIFSRLLSRYSSSTTSVRPGIRETGTSFVSVGGPQCPLVLV